MRVPPPHPALACGRELATAGYDNTGASPYPLPEGAKVHNPHVLRHLPNPTGQIQAQKPQPMHLLSSTAYSKDLFGSFFLVMAP